MTHGSLFSGIGGFELAARWCGFTNVFSCEIEPFNRRVLHHHFPESELHDDIKEMDAAHYNGRVDIISGGFPCQPYSVAGKRLGKEDERHLWPEMLRIIREVAPTYVVGENVRGLVNWSDGMVFEEVCADLEAEGYDVQPFILPAASVGAPHKRDRVWFVAYSSCAGFTTKAERGRQECKRSGSEIRGIASSISKIGNATNASNTGLQGSKENRNAGSSRKEREEQPAGCVCASWQKFPTQPPVCGGDDGLSAELDGITFSKWRADSIKAYGNAIVPQVAYQIFDTIKQMNQ